MRQAILSIFVSLTFFLHSQKRTEIWGCTSSGSRGGGSIYRIDTTGQLHTIHTFSVSDDGFFPTGEFEAVGDILYNTTFLGGKFNRGIVYAYHTKTSTYEKRADIDDSTGWDIHDLSAGPDGKLYALANKGGRYNGGTLLQFDPSTNQLTKFHDFNYGDCCGPYGKLALMNGIFYGTTFGGGMRDEESLFGSYGGGSLFAFDPRTKELKILHSFELQGGSPQGDLTVYKGKLYGMTNYSGLGISEFFDYDPAKNKYTAHGKVTATEDNRDYSEGLTPYKGKLYGMAHNGHPYADDVLFSFHPARNKLKVLHRFEPSASGANPRGRLQIVRGKLYAVSVYGGKHGHGTLFQYTPRTKQLQKIYEFSEESGGHPLTVIARNNKLYGTVSNFGRFNRGGLFEYDLEKNELKNTYWFNTSPEGAGAYGLARSNYGHLVGTTMSGGRYDKGVIFGLNPSTFQYQKVVDFKGSDGANPMAPPVMAGNGRYYGLACNGGNYSGGTLYEYDPLANTITAKVHFKNQETGIIPTGPLAQVPGGKLYGVTSQGGKENRGTFFEYDPLSNSLKIIAHFHEDRFGSNLFGVPSVLGGKVYLQVWKHQLSGTALVEYDPASGTVSDQVLVSKVNGAFTPGSLVELNGKYYGLSNSSYQDPALMVFEFDPATRSVNKLHVFEKSGSMGELIAASDGKLYGTLMFSGKTQNGCFFSLDVTTKHMNVLHEFSGPEGTRPTGLLIEMR